MCRLLFVGLLTLVLLTPAVGTAQEPTPTAVYKPWSPIGKPPGYHWGEFKTDFSKHNIPFDDIRPGGPRKDDIRSVKVAKHQTIDEADKVLDPREPVVVVERGGETAAYPIRILIWHEIINDIVGQTPIAVTYGPLTNSASAFERMVDGRQLEFGVTGRVRYGNMIMYDRQTETWWQQVTGEAFAGELTGAKLSAIPAPLVSWAAFKEANPNGVVLSEDTGYERQYGLNPYEGYDRLQSAFLYRGPKTPETLRPMGRVLTLELNGEAVAYPYDYLKTEQVVNDTTGAAPIVVFWAPGTVSPLDTDRVAAGADVGAAVAFSRELDGVTLTFESVDGKIRDVETGSEWDILGHAVAGPKTGSRLAQLVAINHFWYSAFAFRPNARLFLPAEAAAQLAAGTTTMDRTAAPQLKLDFDVTLFQGADQLGGERMRFSDILGKGKPVVLNLLAGQCPPCKVELPTLQAMADRYAGKMVVVGLDVGLITGLGNRDDAIDLLQALNITFPVGATDNPNVLEEYQILGMPGTVFFKPTGEVMRSWTGFLPEDQLNTFIDRLLAE